LLFTSDCALASGRGIPAETKPRPGLAFTPVPADQAKSNKLEEGVGILATEVVAEKSAASAGIQKGDIIIALDGKPLNFSENTDPSTAICKRASVSRSP
jgi:predicted metalloprotease with PDZ domain